jgi:transcriptional regulator with XRE-family HTH domain
MNISEFVNLPACKIARCSKVRESTLSKYFNGHRDPSYSSLVQMANNLEMQPEEIIAAIRLRREKKLLTCLK